MIQQHNHRVLGINHCPACTLGILDVLKVKFEL